MTEFDTEFNQHIKKYAKIVDDMYDAINNDPDACGKEFIENILNDKDELVKIQLLIFEIEKIKTHFDRATFERYNKIIYQYITYVEKFIEANYAIELVLMCYFDKHTKGGYDKYELADEFKALLEEEKISIEEVREKVNKIQLGHILFHAKTVEEVCERTNFCHTILDVISN